MAKKKVKSEEIVEDTEMPKSNQDWKYFLKMWKDNNIGLDEVNQAMDPLNGVTIRSKILKHSDAQYIIQSASQHKLVADTIKEMTGLGKEQYAKQTLMGKAGEKMKVGPQPKLGIDLRKDVIGLGMSKAEANKFYTLIKNVDLTQINVQQTPNKEKISPSDALIEHVKKEGFELKNFIGDSLGLIIIGYLFVLLFYSLLFSLLVSFILWIFTGFIIYKSLEAYGNDKTWFAQILDDFGNYGFTSQSKDLEDKMEEDKVEIKPNETEVELEEDKTEEEDLTLTNYTEKFDEWRIAKDAVSGPFISAGDKISGFTFNSKSLYKLRLWMFLLFVPLFIWLVVWGFVTWPFFYWYQIIGFSELDADIFSSMSGLFLSYFLIIRFYSHCTNNRNLPINSEMFSDYDNYTVKHLFKIPNALESYTLTLKALLLNFIIGWLMIWVPLMAFSFGLDASPILSILNTFIDSEAFPLFKNLLYVAVFVPFIEELLFRGFVLDLTLEVYGFWPSIFISAILFGLVHVVAFSVLNAFFLGLIYGYVRIKTDSLWPSIFLHSMWNAHIDILIFIGYWSA